MNAHRFRKLPVFLSLAAILSFVPLSQAQQITYYTFDAATPGSYSYGCFDPLVDAANAANNSLLCFNDINGVFGQGASPSPQTVAYPASLGGGNHLDLLITPPVASQSANLWFSVPQNIANGFTSYFAFRFTQAADSGFGDTADGMAFVIQNAQGGGAADIDTACQETGTGTAGIDPPAGNRSGPNIVTGGGGCVGYSGIDNSLAVEFDTFTDSYDPSSQFGFDGNHIAVQNCGAGVNSSSHYGNPSGTPPTDSPCMAIDDATQSSAGSINNNNFGQILFDGNVHESVVEYTGPQGSPANQLQVFIDPPFVAGTHTPCSATDVTNQLTTGCAAAATPAVSITYDLTQHLNLLNGNSAYVGFTASTGASWETQELLSWTFTPHTTVVQPQPLQPAGTPTAFPFGDHTYAVTYPTGGPSTANIDMIVSANTISPANFATLVGPTAFAGSQCQIYDGTGGNCIIYSVYCVNHGTTTKVACPSTSDPTIAVKTAYESANTVPPTSPGFLQGDPFYSPISSVTGDGTTATVNCSGECSITVVPPATTQTITISGNSVAGFNGTFSATPTGIDTFTFSNGTSGTGNGGYITSNNVTNICDGPTDPVPCWQAAKIDGTISGRTKNFSDFVAVSNTASIAGTNTTILAPTVIYGSPAQVTVSVLPSPITLPGPVTGNVTLSIDGQTAITQPLDSTGTTVFNFPGLAGGSHTLNASYAAQGNFTASSATGTLVVSQIAPTVSFTGAPLSAAYLSTFLVSATTNASTVPMITAGPGGVCSIVGNLVTMNSGTGTCNLTATWASDSNYSGASLAQSTAAAKLTPVITWSPAAIPLGAALGVAQLNASANVPGSFGYTPGLGTIVSTVGQTVTALFTPTAAANYNMASKSVALTVTLGPVATISPSSINFGTLYLGAISTKNVTVTNTGGAPMTITGPFLSIVKGGDSHEFVEVNLCPKSLAVGKSCTMTVAFVAGPYYTLQTATLSVMDNAPGSPQMVALTASVINPQASLNTSSLNFGTVKAGTTSAAKIVTLKNTGGTTLTISGITVTGANPGDFTSPVSSCSGSLTAGSSCTLSIAFKPTAKTSRSATLTIKDNALSSPQNVALSGKGD